MGNVSRGQAITGSNRWNVQRLLGPHEDETSSKASQRCTLFGVFWTSRNIHSCDVLAMSRPPPPAVHSFWFVAPRHQDLKAKGSVGTCQ